MVKLWIVPRSLQVRIDEAKMRELGSRMISARDDLDYKSWLEVMQLTVESEVCIVEEFEFQEGTNFGCSCKVGLKGKLCVHSVALYMKIGTINVKDEMASNNAKKKKGALTKPKKQF